MIFRFAFRNVLRNRKRSFLTALTIFFAAIIASVAQAWINGIVNVYVDNYTKYQTGHVRVCTEEFIRREKFLPVDEVIPDSASLIESLSQIRGVRAVRERIRMGMLLSSNGNTVQSMGFGVDLLNSEMQIQKKLVQGSMTGSGMYVGWRLAEKLRIKPGDELLIATKTSEGGLNGIKLRVEGIVRLGMMFDKKCFFMSLEDAKRLLKIHGGTTEIYLYGNDIEMADRIKAAAVPMLPEWIRAETYREQLGEFYTTLENMKAIYGFIEMLILFLASFVIINTMMMAIFERLREIGTIKAMGMTDRELFMNFTLEGSILGAAGGIPGAVAGFLLIMLVSQKGIDFSSQLQSIEMPFEYILRPVVEITDLLTAVGMAIFVPAIAAMIPARYARKLMPSEALRK